MPRRQPDCGSAMAAGAGGPAGAEPGKRGESVAVLPDRTDATGGPPATGPIRGFVAAHLRSHQVSRVIYGAIIGLALVVALEAHPPPPGATIATLLGTTVAVALAEVYSELIGFETSTRRKVSSAEVRHLAADIAAVAFGIAFPAVFFLLAAIGVLEDEAAFTAAKWTGLGLIGLYGFTAARLSGAGLLVSFTRAAAVVLIGALLIVLKALIH